MTVQPFSIRQPSTQDEPDPAQPDGGRRAIHLVGSLPPRAASDVGEALRWVADRVGDQVMALPFDQDPNWICLWLERLAGQPALRQMRRGRYTNYDDLSLYRVRRGQRLRRTDLFLGRAAELEQALRCLVELEAQHPVPPLQVGVPGSLDRALFAFVPQRGAVATARGLWQMGRVLRTVTASTGEEVALVVNQVHRAGREVLLQLETPAVLGALGRAPRVLHPVVARLLAIQSCAILTAAPQVQWVVHLCYGDLAKTPWVRPRDLRPVVTFANALARACARAGIAVPHLGVPVTVGAEAPPTEAAFYQPLRDLDPAVAVVLGLVAEYHPDATSTALAIAEQQLGRRVLAVSRSCGYGRCTEAEAELNLSLCRTVARQPEGARTVRR